MFPRRVTFEHEVAHCLVNRLYGGTVRCIELRVEQFDSELVSLGQAKLTPPEEGNTLSAVFAAGPAQTRITVQALDLDASIFAESMRLEAVCLAAVMTGNDNPTEGQIVAVREMFIPAVAIMERYLQNPEVQGAIQTLALALEDAEARDEVSVEWSALDPLVDWSTIPSPPEIFRTRIAGSK